MKSHMIDSEVYKDLYGTEEMRAIFSDTAMIEKWILFESALAKVEGKLGIIPKEAAEEIQQQGKLESFDLGEICRGIVFTSHPLVPFIRQYEELCSKDYGEYIHFGATTQDVIDTAFILQLKDAYEIIRKQTSDIIEVLSVATKKYENTIMAGRTHGQHALPITFGYKLACWLAEMKRNYKRLCEIQERVFIGQFSGASGTLASLGHMAMKVRQEVIEELGLHVPVITWHTSRDNIAELANVYALIAGTVGKIANEIINLQRTEIAEVEEGFEEGKIGSSTMPHKRNPMVCEYTVGLSRLIRMQIPLLYDSLVQEHERDMGLWLVELEVMPEISIYLNKMLSDMTGVLQNMRVYENRMRENIDITQGLILSEKVMFELSSAIGKQTAHEVVYAASMRSYERGTSLRNEIAADENVNKFISEEILDEILDPGRYLGLCKEFINNVLEMEG
ncbi:adenylosuccinate lyase [Metasolibacillus fluoroglycofenilyticus]|uniref:adenylosuccinate lyase n=1 Tax=Metasolibacillus fluoroglycofenilyticus TaxID=1239396 RepID=UPI000D3CEBB7|nr:adenylosuccinate lyase [Metasolibacillus fluoroglycofenilyticus]